MRTANVEPPEGDLPLLESGQPQTDSLSNFKFSLGKYEFGKVPIVSGILIIAYPYLPLTLKNAKI